MVVPVSLSSVRAPAHPDVPGKRAVKWHVVVVVVVVSKNVFIHILNVGCSLYYDEIIKLVVFFSGICIGFIITRDVWKPNFGSVFKNPNWTEAKRLNPKFQFLWFFSKLNLSHTNSQYLSHSHKALNSSRYGHCWTVNDHESKLSVDTVNTVQYWLSNWAPSHAAAAAEFGHTLHVQSAYTFFCILQLIYKENWTNGFSKPNRNRTRSFSENRTELEKSIPHIPNYYSVFLPSM